MLCLWPFQINQVQDVAVHGTLQQILFKDMLAEWLDVSMILLPEISGSIPTIALFFPWPLHGPMHNFELVGVGHCFAWQGYLSLFWE